jgi:long-chain fatty acid transport protein
MSKRMVVLALALAALAPATAHATPQDLFSIGPRSSAMGMTGVSWSDDWEATYTNPAGLARIRRRQISVGLSGGTFQLQLDGQRSPLEAPRGLTIGFALPLPFGDFLRDRLVLAGAFYTPSNVLLSGQIPFAEVPQWSVLSRAQCLAINVGLGINLSDLVDGLRIGIGVSALANVVGNLSVRLDDTHAFQSVVETQLLASYSPIVGISLDQPNWGAGIVYRHEVRSEMNLHIVVSDLPVMLPTLTIGALVQYDPAQAAIEGYYRLDPNLRVVLNVTARFWSYYPGPYHPTTSGSYLPPAPQFHDTFSPRVAIEGTLHAGNADLVIRGGYALELSPAPNAGFGPQRNADGSVHMSGTDVVLAPLRILDNDRHVLSAGFGLTYRFSDTERLRIDLWGQLHALVDRRHDTTQTATMPTDPNSMTPPPPGMLTSGFAVIGGWMMGLEF